jgi:hypothetical protein
MNPIRANIGGPLLSTTITMAPIRNQRGKRMWPSLPVANHIADTANIFFIGSLVLGVVSSALIVWMASVKEGYWELARQDSDERITELNKGAARLSAEAEAARKETASAQLQLQQIRFPRRLDSDKLRAGIAGMPSQFFEVLYDQSAADGSGLAFEIFVTLASVGWKTDQKLPAPLAPQQGPDNLRDVYQLLPLTQQSGGSAWGVSVVTKGPISEDPKAPERILGGTLLTSVASPIQTVGGGKDETMPAGKIRIIVGPKLP